MLVLVYHTILVEMNKKFGIFFLFLIVLVGVGIFLSRNHPENSLTTAIVQQKKVATPSDTFKEYSDPTGFSFNYPDNISIQSSEVIDASTYASLQLFSKDVNGSLNLVITDSKFSSLDSWVSLFKNATKEPPKELKLGNLRAVQIKTGDRLYLGALDQGVLFTVEVPLIEEAFWMKVYDKVLTDFSFTSPQASQTADSSGSVAFEGEEVVEY